MKKQNYYKMTLEIVYSDGRVETSIDEASKIRERFRTAVMLSLPVYLDGLREIRLKDCAGRVFKSYKQCF